MELILNKYNSDEDEGPKLDFPKVEIAPLIDGAELAATSVSPYQPQSARTLFKNLPYDVMYAPVLGPKPPGKKFLSDMAAETFAIDAFAFDENFHTFGAPGASLLKRRKYRRPEREKKGDPGEIDAYLGPWAKFKEDEDEIREMKERQEMMRRMYELKREDDDKKSKTEKKGKHGKKGGKKHKKGAEKDAENEAEKEEIDAKTVEINAENVENGLKTAENVENNEENVKNSENDLKTAETALKPAETPISVNAVPAAKPTTSDPRGKHLKAPEFDCAPESTAFEYAHERDYQGRSYMHCAPEHRGGEAAQRCFIPKRRVHTWRGHAQAVNAIRWFPRSGHVLLSASMDRSAKLWDVHGHRRCLRTVTGHARGVKDIAFNADGTRFLTVGLDQWIKIWDTETGQTITRLSSGVNVNCARFYPLNDNELLAGQSDKLVVGWDAREAAVVQKYDEHLKAVNALTFIDQNRRFASSGDDKKIFIWEYGLPVVVSHISEAYMNSMPYLTESPDGQWFLGQSMDNAVLVYSSLDSRRHKKRRYVGHSSHGYACQVDVSPDGQFIVSGDSEGKAVFWDFKTKRIFSRLNAHSKVTIGATWHPLQPSKVATCSYDATIKLWD